MAGGVLCVREQVAADVAGRDAYNAAAGDEDMRLVLTDTFAEREGFGSGMVNLG